MQHASAVARIVRRTASWDGLGVAFSITLVAAACFVLYRLLGDVDVEKVGSALRAISSRSVMIAFLLIAASYFTLTFYDFFALRVIGHTHIPYRTAALAGLMSYTIGHNIGATVFTGGLVRFRMYRRWGLGVIDIAKIAFMTGLTFWLGNAVALGIGLIYAPEVASAINQLPASVNRALAVAVLAAIVAYLLWLVPRPRAIGRNGWQVTLPNCSLTLIQIGIGLADLGFSALAMYVLIAAYAPVDFVSAAVAYILGALLGFASHAPGNLGVFDAAMLLALPQVEKEQLLAALLIFRCLYFLIPFAVALSAFGIRELCDPVRRERPKDSFP
jgi:uncharacterized membrane protein YbhN (UPF0104 family)